MMSGRKEVNGFLEELKSILCSDCFNAGRDLILIRSNKKGDRGKFSTVSTLVDLGYDIDDIAGCLRTLSIAEYSQTLMDRDDFNPPLLYVFGKMVEGRTIYIKLKIKSGNKKVVCVSFHYAEHDMNYPYR